jgi:hypothetical protein
MQPIARWRLLPEATAHWRYWDGEIVLHFVPTASTHHLRDGAAAAFAALAGAERPEDELAQRLAGPAPSDEERAVLHDILDTLRTLGLAECRPGEAR